MTTHSSVLAWRIPGTGKPGGLPSLGSHRVGHNWSDLAAAAAARNVLIIEAAFCLTIIYSPLYSASCFSSRGMKEYSSTGWDCSKESLERPWGGKEPRNCRTELPTLPCRLLKQGHFWKQSKEVSGYWALRAALSLKEFFPQWTAQRVRFPVSYIELMYGKTNTIL